MGNTQSLLGTYSSENNIGIHADIIIAAVALSQTLYKNSVKPGGGGLATFSSLLQKLDMKS